MKLICYLKQFGNICKTHFEFKTNEFYHLTFIFVLQQSPSGMHSNWSGSRDNVRKIVEKEGRIARNLITWSVPVAEQKGQGMQKIAVSKCFNNGEYNLMLMTKIGFHGSCNLAHLGEGPGLD